MSAGPSQPGFEGRTDPSTRRALFDLRHRIVLADEVWVGPDPPPEDHYELWYDPDAAPAGTIGMVESGTYTPTLTDITIGTTGAVRTGTYTFVGGSEVGDAGHLDLDLRIVLGTGGSVAAGTGHRISLPPGFEFPAAMVAIDHVVAAGLHRGTSTHLAQAWPASTTEIRPLYVSTAPTLASLSNTAPFTWAAGHSMTIVVSSQVVRV